MGFDLFFELFLHFYFGKGCIDRLVPNKPKEVIRGRNVHDFCSLMPIDSHSGF